MRFRDRVAVVTGGAGGMGREIARRLAGEGARVALIDRNATGARETAEALTAGGAEALALEADVSQKAAVDAAIAAVLARWGAVHVLVNNAGWDRVMPFVETTEELWDRLLAINLKGPIVCTRAVLDAMIAQRYGRIVNIASDAGRVGSSGEAVYAAAKGGVIAFTKAMARELARWQITVNCICPGPSDTPLFRREVIEPHPKLAESLARAIPLGRLGRPQDVAPAVLFLAGDDAGYITGQTLSVSGGLTMV
ncbi:MAG: 3-oxoacyl-ACP reductase family protein [Armatimonadota bacterium]|nr:3-oxoacyl-ACP reductase family protein [Armatimonadota bacterium]MDR7422916.1 3-oxoacyl-ACP reductase family protein [Armatimonadota bacterium]MDR7452974.1 3-oxoacyl-ACP reductase family protein [Armatimonadota bacterium]MDR7456374.1 3-oxoacyl-ACP reductase family protein [Armatimonadota bacterium]MDR7496723.1 3-oxoacyl-ACP reductase family protein [Armatimonadota bacterium]